MRVGGLVWASSAAWIYYGEIYYHRAFLGVLPSGQTNSPAVATSGNPCGNPNKYGDNNSVYLFILYLLPLANSCEAMTLRYLLASCLRRAIASLAAAARGLSKAVSCASSPRDDASPHAVISKEGTM